MGTWSVQASDFDPGALCSCLFELLYNANQAISEENYFLAASVLPVLCNKRLGLGVPAPT